MSKLTPEDLAAPFPFEKSEKAAWSGHYHSTSSAVPVPPHLLPFGGHRPVGYIDDVELYSWTAL